MDGSLLSDKKLIEASRDFVCIRVVTYENAAESEFLQTLGGTRSGETENTTFALLAPDGRTKLSGSGRSPTRVYRGDDEQVVRGLVASMKRIAKKYPGNDAPRTRRPLPYLEDVSRALNVASCDIQPLLLVSVDNDTKRRRVEKKLAAMAWSDDYRGRFAFGQVQELDELEAITGVPEGDAVFVVQPGTYGLKGKVIASSEGLDEDALRGVLDRGLDSFEARAKGGREIRRGQQLGLAWKPKFGRNEEAIRGARGRPPTSTEKPADEPADDAEGER